MLINYFKKSDTFNLHTLNMQTSGIGGREAPDTTQRRAAVSKKTFYRG